MVKSLAVWMAVCAVSISVMGCVERKILVRTKPEGAPVYIDGKPAGNSPVQQKFKFYGRRLVRVGPVKDASGQIIYQDTERIIETAEPWYQLFPLDFFFEVLWPAMMVDEHAFTIHLPRVGERQREKGVDAAKTAIEQAEEYRRESMSAVPSQ